MVVNANRLDWFIVRDLAYNTSATITITNSSRKAGGVLGVLPCLALSYSLVLLDPAHALFLTSSCTHSCQRHGVNAPRYDFCLPLYGGLTEVLLSRPSATCLSA